MARDRTRSGSDSLSDSPVSLPLSLPFVFLSFTHLRLRLPALAKLLLVHAIILLSFVFSPPFASDKAVTWNTPKMDFASLMNNPMAAGLMQRLQSDPELMQLISQPETMQRLQQLGTNPAAAQNDPELRSIMQRLMGGGEGGGGGGMDGMGGMGGMGMGGPLPNPWAAAAPTSASSASSASSSSSHSYVTIHGQSQYQAALKNAGNKLVVVDFTTSWCGSATSISRHNSNQRDPHMAHIWPTYHLSEVMLFPICISCLLTLLCHCSV